jgi:hypothetical protein
VFARVSDGVRARRCTRVLEGRHAGSTGQRRVPRCTSARGTRRCHGLRRVVLCSPLCSAGTRRCPARPRCRHLRTFVQRRARTPSDTRANTRPPWSVWPDKSPRIAHKAGQESAENQGTQTLGSLPRCRVRSPAGGAGGKAPAGAQGQRPARHTPPHIATPRPRDPAKPGPHCGERAGRDLRKGAGSSTETSEEPGTEFGHRSRRSGTCPAAPRMDHEISSAPDCTRARDFSGVCAVSMVSRRCG